MLRLKKEGIVEDLAAKIAEKVWSDLVSRDVRDAIKVHYWQILFNKFKASEFNEI